MIEAIRRDGTGVRIGARARSASGECPRCEVRSSRVHSRYRRRLADVAIAAQQVVIELRARRFFCDNPGCTARTFAEQVSGLTTRYARRTVPLRGTLEAIGLALAGRAGAYADGCTRGAPQATQCTDRWHLWKNLGDAVEETVIAHRECLRNPTDPTDAADSAATAARAAPPPSAAHSGCDIPVADVPHGDATAEAPPGGEARLAPRSRERYAQVHALRAQGKGMRTIGKELDLDRKTVRRFLQADGPDQICFKATSRARILDDHRAYLHRRWTEGCTNASQLFTEIRAQGYCGSVRTVYRYLQTFRHDQTLPDPRPPSPVKVRHVVGWIMQDTNNLVPEDEQCLQTVLKHCPELAAARRHVGAFAHMIRDLRGDRLPEWIDRVHADNLPALHSFITGLYQDLDAVTAGLTLEHNNGRAEGTVNRIKAVKRAMFGRANLDLLKKRILLT